jgi:hypothetical protein
MARIVSAIESNRGWIWRSRTPFGTRVRIFERFSRLEYLRARARSVIGSRWFGTYCDDMRTSAARGCTLT